MKELAFLFLKLGSIGFGGPAAHIALMEDEVVRRRQWMSREHFLDLVGAANIIPGPNSTELAIHVGFVRNGWKGLVLAGVCFIIPAVTITLILARLYVSYGSLPVLQPLMWGIRPAIVAVILAALLRLSKPLLKNRFAAGLGILVAALSLAGMDELLLLFLSGLLGLLWQFRDRWRRGASFLMGALSLAILSPPVDPSGVPAGAAGATLVSLGLFFLKIGSILYGSGYVLVAFLQGGLVDARHWLSQTQLFDAVAAGQFTPGPLLSTATFIGYLILGIPGAAVATVGIFLPSFVFVLVSAPFIPALRRSGYARGFLDGLNAASLGLMLAVTVTLALSAYTGAGSCVIAVLAVIVVVRWNVHAAWVVLGGALLGWLISIIAW